MKKKIMCIVTAAMMAAVLLAGCGGNRSGGTETQSETQKPAEEPAAEKPAAEEPAKEPTAAYDAASFDAKEVYTPEEHQVTTVYEGCETFTQMLDREENKGKGYVNARIGDQDVLLVADQTYEYEPGKNAAIDAEIFYYTDEGPAYMDYVEAGGTAYPLTVKDGLLYVGGNHFMIKYTIKGDRLDVSEEVYVQYNENGDASYYYRTGDSAFADHDASEAEAAFERMFGELDEESVLFFDIIGGGAAELPRYEYPEDDAVLSAISDYMTNEISQDYEPAGVSIPGLDLVDRDDTDPEDVKVWGYFSVWNYDADGDILKMSSGGAYPGLFHVKDNKDGTASVISFDRVADGSDYTPSAKKIFGDRYEKFEKLSSDDEAREKARKETIKRYVEDNGLNISAYQDPGWDPVKLQ
ncbi:MAG: hypothetical protein IJS86_07560 [Lachnospiraceae bacterium]|nr:hypothetical protein [Lachnospiraceae bacterium]